jgi:hypothetical protein
MRLLFVMVWVLLGIMPAQAEPGTQAGGLIYYHRIILQSLPGELAVGTPVVFEATAEMGIGQTGTTTGTIYGYSFRSPANVKPPSYRGAFNRAEWPTITYIIWIDRHPGNDQPWAYTALLERGRFELR